MLLSSAYRTKRWPRRSNSRSSSSSTRLLSSGESGPPCGVPSTLGLHHRPEPRGHPHPPPPASGLGFPPPPPRPGFLSPVHQLSPDGWQLFFQMVGHAAGVHPTAARTSFIPLPPPQCFLQVFSLT